MHHYHHMQENLQDDIMVRLFFCSRMMLRCARFSAAG